MWFIMFCIIKAQNKILFSWIWNPTASILNADEYNYNPVNA